MSDLAVISILVVVGVFSGYTLLLHSNIVRLQMRIDNLEIRERRMTKRINEVTEAVRNERIT